MVRMRSSVALLVVAACKTANHDDHLVDAGVDFNTVDATVDARNMCDNTPGVLLAPRVDIAVGMGPYGIAVADFNGDGLLDLAIATQQPGGATILLNGTPGCMAMFQPFVDIPTRANVHSAVAADFNNDGIPDLAAVSQLYDLVTVMMGTTPTGATSPVFDPPLDFATGTNPSWVAAGDVNGDGKPDLVTAAPDAISVLIDTAAEGATAPSFQDKVDLPHTGETFGLALGDFNSDGRLDIAVVDTTSNTVSVYLNTTSGVTTFAAPVPFPTGMSPFAVAVRDLDGDHRPDIVVANIGADTVSVLMNTTPMGASAPSFAAKVDLPTGMRPYAVALGDLNRDGHPDIVVADETSNAISILLASGGAFAAKIDVPVGNSPHGVRLADLDGDNAPDLIVSNSDDATISILLAR